MHFAVALVTKRIVLRSMLYIADVLPAAYPLFACKYIN